MSKILQLAESLGVSDQDMTKALRRGVVSESEMVNAARMLGAAWNGRSDRIRLAVNEALTTSDLFRSATGDVLDREMLAQYQTMPKQWDKFASRTTVKDFRPKKLTDLVGGRTALARVPEHTNYPEATYSLSERTLTVAKYGEQYGYSFEARINDQLNELQTVPNSWAGKCLRTEDDVALATLADPLTGAPNPAMFNATNKNLGNVALTAENFQAAITTIKTKRQPDGSLLYPGELQLIVGPAQEFTARRLLGSQTIETTTGGVKVIEQNPFAGFKLTVLDNLVGNAWFVIPTPGAARPAFYIAFLTGYETPDVRYKNDQGKRVGGGDIGLDDGSFDDDTCYWRVRHIVGAAIGDPVFTYASLPA